MTVTFAAPAFSRRRVRTGIDLYVLLLALTLASYAILGKGFAYLGVPPLYMGEIMFLLGLAAALRSGCLPAAVATIPGLLLLALLGLVGAACARDFGRYGMETLRDSVIVVYGVYAFITAALLLEKPGRIELVIGYFRRFTTWFLFAAPVLLVLSFFLSSKLPALVTGSPFFFVRPGEAAVHLAGAVAFSLLGFRRETPATSLMMVTAAGMVIAQSRGGMMALVVPTMLASLFAKDRKQILRLLMLLVVVGSAGALAAANFRGFQGRSIDLGQVVANVTSIFGYSDTGNLDGTKAFRLRWWSEIVNYTFHGDQFWTGKGFGINLAQSDGFVVGTENVGAGPLRSPHNGHMTILARAGVPGLALWAALLVAWFAMLGRNALGAFRAGEQAWGRFFIFIGCYALSVIIDASFDVALEGPMIGIWFWVVIGLGMGTSMVYRARYPGRSVLRAVARLPAAAILLAAAVLTPAPSSALAQEDSGPEPSRRLINKEATCLTIRNETDRVVENMVIGPCGEHGIEVLDSTNITIRNLTVFGTGGIGVRVYGSDNVKISGNTIADTLSGTYVLASKRIRVTGNLFRNPRGPVPRGQFVQFDGVQGAENEISCNTGRNDFGEGKPEDAINLYRSSGTAESPILVKHNKIIGGGPSLSGGGIMLGDDGGSHQAAKDNILEDPGQYGIGVAAGTDMEISGNVITGRKQPFTNVGISVWRQYLAECGRVTVSNNLVRWYSKSGRANPWWDGKNCGAINGLSTNNFAAGADAIERRKEQIRSSCKARPEQPRQAQSRQDRE